jgi:thiamine-monophosphate kinase
MKLREVGELTLLDKIRARFAGDSGRKSGPVLTTIGDDAAVLRIGGKKLLATTDMMVEAVHFDTGLTRPEQAGFKLISANVSDIYAMGGKPLFALLTIAAPAETEVEFIDGLLDGVGSALGLYGLELVGGDLSSTGGRIALSATVLGTAERPVLRSGARTGDKIYVTGFLGDSACGLELLKRMGRPVDLERPVNRPLKWDIMLPLLRRHLMPEARRPGVFARHATAMIDISDGLFMDLTRLCTESGAGARLHMGRLPVSPQMLKAASVLGLDPARLATAGGEDYELLFTAPPSKKINSGISIVYEDGSEKPLRPEGYTHWGGGAC